MSRILFLVSLLFAGLAHGDEQRTNRVLENPVQDGDLVLRVNDGGVKTDALSVIGSTGATTIGAAGNTNAHNVVGPLTTNSYFRTAAGAASAPSYSFTGASNLGMYYGGADTLKFSTAGVERLSVNATGLAVTGTISASNVSAGSCSTSVTGSTNTDATPTIVSCVYKRAFGIVSVKIVYNADATAAALMIVDFQNSTLPFAVVAGSPHGTAFRSGNPANNGIVYGTTSNDIACAVSTTYVTAQDYICNFSYITDAP